MYLLARKAIVIFTLVIMISPAAWADKPIFGWVEMARIEALETDAKAKLDSGALTSSIHAEDIERFERDGEDWVRFTLELEDETSSEIVSERLERPVYRKLRVQGAGGEESRTVVLLELCMGDTRYEEQFSLNDRSDMIYPILLGRRTIQHLGAIDVTRTFLHEPECDEDDAVRTQEEQETDEDIRV